MDSNARQRKSLLPIISLRFVDTIEIYCGIGQLAGEYLPH
jgi:hypothetical protein